MSPEGASTPQASSGVLTLVRPFCQGGPGSGVAPGQVRLRRRRARSRPAPGRPGGRLGDPWRAQRGSGYPRLLVRAPVQQARTSGSRFSTHSIRCVSREWASHCALLSTFVYFCKVAKARNDATSREPGDSGGGLLRRGATGVVCSGRRPYFNIFALTEELRLDPFTPWTRSQQWSPHGLEVDAAILQARACLPSPCTLHWPQL